MRRLIYISFLFLCVVVNAQKFTVAQVYNPKVDGQNYFVSDAAHVFSSSARNDLNDICCRLEQSTGVEVAIVVVPSIEGDDEYAFAYELFNHWRIGKEGKNNGLLWLYVVDIRAMKFETGYGLEGLLPDAR